MFTRRQALAALTATPILLTAAACGTTDAPTDADQAPGSADAGSGPITLTDGRGKEITLDGPVTRLVALEWQCVENAISLGLAPIGIADIEGFQTWNTSVELTGDPTDVGVRREPSIERIASLEPDLIIGTMTSIPDAAMAQIERIAPVLLQPGADASRAIDATMENMMLIATALGKEAESTALKDQLMTHIKESGTKLTDAGATDHPYVFCYVNATGSDISFRMHGVGSTPGAVCEQMGLENAWTDPGDEEWGISNTDLEGLTTLPDDTRILYWADPAADPVTGDLAKNPTWASIAAVKQGNVHRIDDGIWLYGGPASLTRWADTVVDALS